MVSDGLVKVSKVRTSVPSISIPKASRGVPHVPYDLRNRKQIKVNRQHAKSLADIVLGNPFTGTLQLQHTLEDAGLGNLINVPIVNRLAGFAAMTKERTFDPLMNGELGKVLINTVESAGDTLDALANPVKSLLPWAGGGTGEDFLKSMGWLEGEYRKTYQWDTGNFFLDLAGEMISDPVNWFTWGSGAVRKQGAKAVTGQLDDMLGEVYVGMKSTAGKEYLKDVLDAMPKGYRKKIEKGFVDFLASPESAKSVKSLKATFYSLLELDVDAVSLNQAIKKIQQASDAGLFKSFQQIAKVHQTAKGIDTWLARVAWGSTPVGASVLGVKYAAEPVKNAIVKSFEKKLKEFKFQNPADVAELSARYEYLKQETIAEAIQYTDATKSSIMPVLQANNMDYYKATNLYLDMVTNAGPGDRTFNNLKRMYKIQLESMMPGVYIAEANDRIWAAIETTQGTRNLLNTSPDIIKLSTPVELDDKFVSVIIPASLYSDFFYNVSGLGNTLFYGTNTLMTESINLFKSELNRYFKKTTYDVQYKTLQQVAAKSKLSVDYLKLITDHAYNINRTVKELQRLAFDALKGAGLDMQSVSLLWRRLRDPDIMTQLGAFDAIINVTKSKAFQDAYKNLQTILQKQMTTLGDTSVDVYLNKILSIYNDLKATMNINNRVSLYPIENILDYIDNGYLRIGNNVYHLNNIEDFLSQLDTLEAYYTKGLEPGSKKYMERLALAKAKRTQYLTVLDYFGIRRDNSFTLSELLRSRDKEALDKIHIILEQGKTGRRATSKVVDHYSDQAVESYSKAMKLPSTHKEVTKVINNMPKDKNLLTLAEDYERLLRENTIKLQASDTAIHNMLISNVNVSGMNQLEIVASIKNIDLVEFDELWRTLKDYDYTNIDLDTYKEILTQVGKLNFMIDIMEETIKETKVPINETLYAFFQDLRNMTNAIGIPDVTNSILEQDTLEQSLYRMLLSREGMYHIINENVFNNLQADYKPWIDMLKDPDAPLRHNYNQIVRSLRDAGETRGADALGNFLLKLDSHTAVNRLIKFDVTGKFIDYDKTTLDFIKALPYNTIASDNFRNKLAVNVYTHPEEIVNAIMKDIESYHSKDIMNSVYKRMAEITNIEAFIMKDAARYGIQVEFVDALKEPTTLGMSAHKENKIYLLKHIPKEQALKNLGVRTDTFLDKVKNYVQTDDDAKLLTYLHEISHFQNLDSKKGLDISSVFREVKARNQSLEYLKALKNPKELYDLEIRNLRANVYVAIKTYLNSILDAEEQLGIMNTKVYSILDAQTIDNFKYIANHQEDLVKILSKDRLYIDAKNELSNITDYIYGSEVDHSIKSSLDTIREASGKDFEDFFEKGDYNSVASAFYEAVRIIGQENHRLAGAIGDMKDLTKIQNLLTKSELNDTIRDLGQHTNFYDWSISNRYISSVKVFDSVYAAQQGISPNTAIRVKSNEDYLKFYNAYRVANDRARYIMNQYNPETLNQVKAALIHTYSYPGSIGAPLNAQTYFSMLDIDDPDDALRLVTWDGLTRISDLAPDNKRRFVKYLGEKFDLEYPTGSFLQKYDRAEFFRNPWRWYEAVDAATKETNIIDIDAISDLININPPLNVLEDLYMRVDYNISTLCKTPELLLNSKVHYTNYINDDLAARKRLDYLTDFQKKAFAKPEGNKVNPYIIGKIEELSELELQQYAEAGLKPGNNKYDYRGWIYMKNQVDNDLLQTVLRSDASGVRAMLDHNNQGAMFVFAPSEYPFKATQEELKEWGVLAFKKDDDLWILRRTDTETKANQITWQVSDTAFKEGRDVVKKLLEDNSIYLNLDGMNVPAHLLTGDMVDTDFWEYLKTSKLFSEELGDEVIQKSYMKITSEGIDDFYKKNYSRPQMLVFGVNGYNRLIDYVERHNDGPLVHFRRKSNRLDSAVSAGMMDVIVRHNRETKLMSLFFNDEYSLGNPTFTRALADYTDKDIKRMFSKGNYVAAIIREDSKGRPRVHRFPVTNRKSLNEAIEMGAHVFTEEIFRNMSLTINSHTIENRALKIYRQLIVGGFKSIWLTSPGALFRNFVDSSVYKNATELGGVEYLMDAFKYEYQAGKLLDFYDKIQREVFKRTGNQTFNKEVLTNVLNALPARDRELYYITDIFVNSGASGGLSASFEQFLLQFNKTASGNVGQLWEDTVARMLFEGTYSPVRVVMDLNSKIEQTARYGLFLGLINQGEDVTSAIQHVIKTHFDYVYKTGGEDLLEQVFWFITFPINNILYYVNEGLERNPTMLKLLLDANELSWNDGEYTYDAIKEKPYLQYHAITGNIRIRTNDGKKDVIIKIGPSLFDFIQFMIKPIDSFKERLNPFLAVALGQEGWSELNPINSQLGRLEQIRQGKSLLPSIYTTWDIKQYLRPEYKSYQRSSSWNFKTKPKTGKRFRPGSKNYIAYKSRKHWVQRTYLQENRWNNRFMKPISYEPYWDPASNKYRGTFNRQRRLYAKLPKPNTLDYINKK